MEGNSISVSRSFEIENDALAFLPLVLGGGGSLAVSDWILFYFLSGVLFAGLC